MVCNFLMFLNTIHHNVFGGVTCYFLLAIFCHVNDIYLVTANYEQSDIDCRDLLSIVVLICVDFIINLCKPVLYILILMICHYVSMLTVKMTVGSSVI